jgi:hypothetical protein
MIQQKIILTFNCIIIASVGDNPNLCGSGSCKTKKNSFIVPRVAPPGGGLVILAFFVAAILSELRRRRKQEGKTKVENFLVYSY